VEGKDAGMDAEKYVPTQHLDVSVLKIEGFMYRQGRGVDDERLVVGSIGNREVGEGGDAGRWRLRNEGYRNCRCL